MIYPRWIFFPRSDSPPAWVSPIVSVFAGLQSKLDTVHQHNKSDAALSLLRPQLETAGYHVEGGAHEKTIYRPVHFGEQGKADREYQIDAYHPELRVGLEVEAGRSIRGNAIYRDIIQASLMVDLDYLALAIPLRYRFNGKGKPFEDKPYEHGLTVFDAIYASERFRLPLKGVLFIGY